MSDLSSTNPDDSLPHEARLTCQFCDNVVQQDSEFGDDMILDGQTPVGQPPELLDRGVPHDFFSENTMPLPDEAPLEQPHNLLDDGLQQGSTVTSTMALDLQSSTEQPSELHSDGKIQPGDLMEVDYGDFDPEQFLRDIAEMESSSSAWWAKTGGSLLSDGAMDFGPFPDGPVFSFETDSTSPPIDFTAQAPPADPVNSSGLGGLPTILDTAPISTQPQQVFTQSDTGSSHYPNSPPALHSLPYDFTWEEITQRQLSLLNGNGPGQFITNSGTGTVLEAIPENEARPSGLSTPPPKQPSRVDYLNTAANTLATPTPSPILQAASVKRQPAERRHTVATGRNQPAVKFPIHNNTLLVGSVAEAKDTANTRIKLYVSDDDSRAVASRAGFWIPRIAQTFDSGFLPQPDDGTRLTAEGQAEWTRWQTEHENKVWSILASHLDAPKLAQSCACIFYTLVLEAHEGGKGLPYVGKTIANPGPNIHLKCSDRINAAISVLEKFPIVRYDFLKQDRLDGLAANPEGFVNRKIDNMWVNYKKKHNTGPVKEEPVKTEAGTAKKRKASGAEQPFDTNGRYTGELGGSQSKPKRARATPKKHASQVTLAQVKGEDDDEIL